MSETISPPASTPSPNAAQPSTPAAAPEPQELKQQTVGEESGVFDALDKMAGEKPADKPAKPDAKPADKTATPKPEEAKLDTAKPDAKPADKPTEEMPTEKMAPKALRDAYDTFKRKLKEVERELGELKSKSATPQEAVFDPEKDPRWTQMKERADKLEEAIKYRDYEQSSEYQDKYQKPYDDAWTNALPRATDLKKVSEDGSEVNVTEGEFWRLVQTHSENDAADMVNKFFPGRPDKAGRLIALADKVREAGLAATKAKADFKKNIAQRDEQMKLETQRKQQADETKAKARIAKWQELDNAAASNEETKEFYQPADGDTKAAELLAKGSKDAQRAFLNGAPLEDGDKPLTDEELIALHVAVKNKAAVFDHVIHKYKLSQARNAELEKQIAGFKASSPGAGESSDATRNDESSMDALIDKAAVPGRR